MTLLDTGEMAETGRDFRHYIPLYCLARLSQPFQTSVEP